MKKLLHVIDSLGVGGAEKLLVGVINSMKGYEHHLVILGGPESVKESINTDYRFLNLGIKTKIDFLRAIRKLKKYIRSNHIDIVHSHLYESNILSRLATPTKIPLINSIHAISSLASYKINKMSLYLEKMTYKKRHVLIAVSRAVLDDFEKWIKVKGQSHVIYNFIEERFFIQNERNRYPSEPLKLVAVGNLRWQKNYPYLIDAFRKLPSSVHLDIYGEGDMSISLQEQIDKYHLNIRLMGMQNELEKRFKQYDIFVMSSFFEGNPLSLLESIAAGLPALLADIPELREVLEDDAIYFDLNDTDDFVKRINEIINNKYDLKHQSMAAYQKVNSFARKTNYLKKLSEIYESFTPAPVTKS